MPGQPNHHRLIAFNFDQEGVALDERQIIKNNTLDAGQSQVAAIFLCGRHVVGVHWHAHGRACQAVHIRQEPGVLAAQHTCFQKGLPRSDGGHGGHV